MTYSGGGEWNFSEDITIMENSDQNLVNYQVLLVLNSSNFNFSSASPAGEDIRFTSGETQLKYWIEEWDLQKETASIWVRVPYIAARGNAKITMFYGNPLAIDASSGASTFEFFDDFAGPNINFGKWDRYYTGGGEIDINGGMLKLIVPKFHPEDVSQVKSEETFAVNSMLVTKRKKVTTGEDSRGPVIEQGFVDPHNENRNQVIVRTELQNETYVSWVLENQKGDARYFPKDMASLNVPEDTWYTTGVAWYVEDELGRVAFFEDGSRVSSMDLASTEEANYVPITDMKAYLFASTYSDVSKNMGYAAFDYAYVRKFVPEEPAVIMATAAVLMQENDSETTPAPVKINIAPPDGKINAIRIFDTAGYNDSTIADLKDSGLNLVMLRVDSGNIWSLERFVKNAHDNGMQVYAMLLSDPERNTEDNSASVREAVDSVMDYNNKSLAGFDGINIALNPCSEDPETACEDSLMLVEGIRESTNSSLPLAVDVPFSYDRSAIGEVSDHVEIFVILTYDAEGNSQDSTANIVDSIAAKMGEIRAAGGDALISVAVDDDFMTDENVQELLERLQDYYAQDPAFMGTEIVVYSEYLDYTEVSPATTEESSPVPGFDIILAIAAIFVLVFTVRKK
ncbi:DUF2341 domain-containing protein [Methanolobus halotolerans]|uniref:DUF2341 domain-containing protein n=1 Tax=Methanolobus halotolerans TaxID=2052935 RepID=UPI00107F3851|nr:DUF2341 domain-containing protein [Methanolobus halotolerans]